VNAVLSLLVAQNGGRFSSGCTSGGLSRRAQLHRVSSADRTNFARASFLCFVPQRVSLSLTSLEFINRFITICFPTML
jgi:hypothetical protein